MWATRRFQPLFWTQFFGAFNDNLLKSALVILVTFQNYTLFGIGSEQLTVLAGGIFILPFFLFSATAGQVSDLLEKSKLIKIIKLSEVLIMVIASSGFIFGQVTLLFGALFLMGLHSTFFGPLKYSSLPQLLKDEELLAGNAWIEAGTFLSILLGTLLGGILIAQTSGSIWISIAMIVVAVAGLVSSQFILKMPSSVSRNSDLKIQWNPFPPTLKILEMIKNERSIFLAIMGISWFWFYGAAMLALFPIYAHHWLHANETVVTLFLAVFSVGIGAGSMLCGFLSRGRIELGLVPIGSAGMSLFVFDLFMIGSPFSGPVGIYEFMNSWSGVRILLDLFLTAVYGGLFIVPLYTLIQDRADSEYCSRVIAGNNIYNALFMTFASIMLAVMLKFGLSIYAIFLILAVMNVFVSIYIYTVIPEFLFRLLTWVVANLMYRLKIEGEENIPNEGPALLVCNHVSFVDWLIISAAVRRPIRFIMDHTFAQGFFAKRFAQRGKAILISTSYENPSMLKEAFEKTRQELADGQLVCIFPEGKLTPNGEIQNFKNGVEKILQETPVQVIPMGLSGLWGSIFSRKNGKAFSSRPKKFWPKVQLVIGSAISPKMATPMALKQKVNDLIVSLLLIFSFVLATDVRASDSDCVKNGLLESYKGSKVFVKAPFEARVKGLSWDGTAYDEKISEVTIETERFGPGRFTSRVIVPLNGKSMEIGEVRYVIVRDGQSAVIGFIEVHEFAQRQGFMSLLTEHIVKQNPGLKKISNSTLIKTNEDVLQKSIFDELAKLSGEESQDSQKQFFLKLPKRRQNEIVENAIRMIPTYRSQARLGFSKICELSYSLSFDFNVSNVSLCKE